MRRVGFLLVGAVVGIASAAPGTLLRPDLVRGNVALWFLGGNSSSAQRPEEDEKDPTTTAATTSSVCLGGVQPFRLPTPTDPPPTTPYQHTLLYLIREARGLFFAAP